MELQSTINISARRWDITSPPKKILAIRLQAMGDTVITLPYLQSLRQSMPATTQLHLLTRKEVDPIPRAIQLFDKVYSIGGGRDFKKQLVFAGLLLPRLLFNRYDVVLDLQNNSISRLVRKTIRPHAWSQFEKYAPVAAGERTRLTIAAAGFTNPVSFGGFAVTQTPGTDELLINNGWNGDSLVVLNPAGAFSTRNWPMQYYIEFANLWLQHFPGSQFLVMGTSFIETKAMQLKHALGNKLINLVGKTTPATAFTILQRTTLVLSEDSGLMHMAWVSGIPTMVLFGSTKSEWSRPLGIHAFFLDAKGLPCGPCMSETCAYGDVHCLARFLPAMVFQEAVALLDRCKRTPAAQ